MRSPNFALDFTGIKIGPSDDFRFGAKLFIINFIRSNIRWMTVSAAFFPKALVTLWKAE